jgi:starvation-inducible DNA-binding protein
VPSDLSTEGVKAISASLRHLLADIFTLFVKTKNFHWHMRGPHFRDYHLLLDEQSEEIFAMVDDVAERARKIGGATLRSIGDILRSRRLDDNDQDNVGSTAMLAELCRDNRSLTRMMRESHEVCDRFGDVATASLIENWIDQAERRSWFLSETTKDRQTGD